MLDYFFQAAIGLAGIMTLFLGFQIFLTIQRNRLRKKQKRILLSIRVSRENEKLPIVAEQIFAVLHGIIHSISFFEKLRGVSVESLSFEIANVDSQIKFFVHTPVHLRNFIENQIYAQYPDVEIEETKDYLAEQKTEICNPDTLPEISETQELSKVEASLAPSDAKFKSLDNFSH